ncbi:S8 family serine peptidase [Maridesulfovibrio sp.]|uniref:S8 family serine peptidase n=1 Tax=Maridesulfovibrio sp. TaxID=2795000 RepID=UPI003BAD2C57
MKNRPLVIILIVLISALSFSTAFGEGSVKNQLIVKFKTGISEDDARAVATTHYMDVVAVLNTSTRESGQCILLLRSHLSTQEMINEISGLKEVYSYAPNYIRKKKRTPDDTEFPDQWALQNSAAGINAPDAWDSTTGGADVVIAVIDSGIDLKHEDLHDNLWNNPVETFNQVDDDGNGVVDDVYGISIDNGVSSNSTQDTEGHGTTVSSVIAAKGNNNLGVAGVSWNSKIMVLRVVNSADAEIIVAINYIIQKKKAGINIPVLNMSIGGPGGSTIIRDKIQELADNSIIFTTSAGNDGYDNDNSNVREYPASFDIPNIISVGASNSGNNKPDWSHFGQYTVDLFAPGEDIMSAKLGGGYTSADVDGTSFAAPHVAGVAALLASLSPDEDIYTRISRILSSTDAGSSFSGKCLTGGKLNADSALDNDLSLIPIISGSDSRDNKREGNSFTLYGQLFGTTQGEVYFCNKSNRVKASINTWSDTEISGVVPQDAGTFVQVTTSSGLKSNALQFSAWTNKQAGSQPHGLGASVVRNGKIYVFGGGILSQSTKCESYDPDTNEWTQFTTMPEKRSGAGTVFYNDEMYFIGGLERQLDGSLNAYTDVIKYSFATNAWSTLPGTVPYPGFCAAAELDGQIYVFGGNSTDGSTVSDDIYTYDPGTGDFSEDGQMDIPRFKHTAITFGNSIYIFGGITSDGAESSGVSTVAIYNGTASTISGPDISSTGVTSDGQTIFLTNGAMTINEAATPFLYLFNPTTNAWDYGNNTIQQPGIGRIGSLLEYIDGRGIYSVSGLCGEADDNGLTFLSTPAPVNVPSSQPDSSITINITQTGTSFESAGELKTKYNLSDSGDRVTDVREFSATVSKTGALIHLQYEFTASDSTLSPSEMTLYKLKDADSSNLTYQYADTKNEWRDGSWWLEDSSGNYIDPALKLTSDKVYAVHFCLQDNGSYDQNSAEKIIDDPLVLFSGTSGSSGCVLSKNADMELDFMLGAFGLFCLIICSWLRRRA